MHATTTHLLTQAYATIMGNYTWIQTPVGFFLLKKLTYKNITGGLRKPFIHTQTHACDCSGEIVYHTPPQITTTKHNSSSESVWSHIHSYIWRNLPPSSSQTHMCHHLWRSCSQSETSIHVHQVFRTQPQLGPQILHTGNTC